MKLKLLFTLCFFSILFTSCKKEPKDTFIEVSIKHNLTNSPTKSYTIFAINDWDKNGENATSLSCPSTKDGDVITYNVKDFIDTESLYTTFVIRGTIGYPVPNGYVQKKEIVKSTIKDGQSLKEVIEFE